MIIGRYICCKCGKDCTPPAHAWGMGLMVRGAVTPGQQKDLNDIKERYGTCDWVMCWECAAVHVFGAKPLTDKTEQPNKPVESKNSKTKE